MLQYGRGIKSIAEQIKSHDGPITKQDIEEAKNLSDDFFHHYPMAKKWMDGNYKKAREIGYVEDLWGRRRRLPDASLPKYEFSFEKEKDTFNPLLNTEPRKEAVPDKLIKYYSDKLNRCFKKEDRDKIINEAKKNNIKIVNNSGFIAQAERQSINAPIQGGSATMTKLAMKKMYFDPELNELDFHLLIPVHDELIGEIPAWNIEEGRKRMEFLMIHAGEPECKIPMKCDAVESNYWYEDVFSAHVKEDYEKLIKEGLSHDEAVESVYQENNEFTKDEIIRLLNN